MSSSSSEEDFYDAQSAGMTLLSRYMTKERSPREDLTLVPGLSISLQDDDEEEPSCSNPSGVAASATSSNAQQTPSPASGAHCSSDTTPDSQTPPSPTKQADDAAEVRVQRLEETRRRLGEEEDSCQSSSQTSSMDGLYPRSRPFKMVEQDRNSVSGVRVRPPDIVSSCIDPVAVPDPCPPPPQPPPRHKKKRNKSPTISIASNVLGMNMQSAASSTVTAQDEDKTRARSQGPRVIRKTEQQQDVVAEELPPAASVSVQSPPEKKFFVRTKTDSGKMMSDQEILEQVTVVNLDTGERIPLSSAEEKIPACINPLSLHIMRLTSELDKLSDTDSDSDSKKSTTSSFKRRGLKFKKLLSDVKSKALTKAKSLTAKSEEVEFEASDDTVGLKTKVSPKHKGPYDFENLQLVQDLGVHEGPIWCMKFSNCGRLLATAGQDRLVRVWVLKSCLDYFQDLLKTSKISPTNSLESVPPPPPDASGEQAEAAQSWPFVPLSSYSAHTADLLDIAWSKSFFLLSSSMDRTVRLWHISRRECLCCFQHIDFVTAIAFHPRDDRYFLSGSLDGKLRLWNIPDKKVALWNEVPGPNNLITTANFCQNGKFAVVGTYDGRCIFYHTEQLKYHTQITLNKKKLGKITGIDPMPGEDKILVTSNDSRIRLYDLRDLSLTCKYTGAVARSSQIKASFSHDGKFIVSGSENMFIYLWRAAHEYTGFGGARRDRNSYWEGVKAHNAVVTCAIFAPDPDLIIKEMDGAANYSPLGYVLASADFNGNIKVFVCRVKQKCSSLPASAIA